MARTQVLGAIIALVTAWCAVAAHGCTSLDELAWLLGDWEARADNRIVRESWRRVSRKTFEGQGATLISKDRVATSTEALRIVRMQEEVFFLAKVASNDTVVAFRMTHCDDGTVTFENPAHDFPRRIEYRHVGTGRIDAHVSDGAESGFSIEYHRQKPDADAAGDR